MFLLHKVASFYINTFPAEFEIHERLELLWPKAATKFFEVTKSVKNVKIKKNISLYTFIDTTIDHNPLILKALHFLLYGLNFLSSCFPNLLNNAQNMPFFIKKIISYVSVAKNCPICIDFFVSMNFLLKGFKTTDVLNFYRQKQQQN